MSAKNMEEVVVGFESAGPYAEPLLHYLMKKKVKLAQRKTFTKGKIRIISLSIL